jgi:hypothetical protein
MGLKGDEWQFHYELLQDCWATHEQVELRRLSAEIFPPINDGFSEEGRIYEM